MKKIVALVLIAMLVLGTIATALVVLGGDDEPDQPAATPQVGRDGSLKPFVEQEVKWSGCGKRLECGWLQVPLDHAHPDGERINLALVKRLAAEQPAAQGALVVNPGGPGAAGTDMAVQADFVFSDQVTAAYDVVGFDPRGTGRSAPLDCLSDAELDAYVATDPTPDTPEEVATAAENAAAFARGCREKSGDLVEHVSTVDVARDMDILRAVLGEETLNYHGASYGTALGATYAELFPKQVGRFVLDAGLDPSVSSLDASLTQAGGFETALRSYAAHCLKSSSCPLSGNVDEAVAQVGELLEKIDQKPLPGDDDRELTEGQAFYGIALPLYYKDYWSLLTSALRSAFTGDGADLLELADLYSSREDGKYVDNSMEAIGIINCLDDPWSVGADEVPGYFDRFEQASPTFGKVFAWGLMACGEYGFDEPEKLDVKAEGAAPILVTGTTRDPATPLVWAEALAEQLDSGVLVRRDGDGHGAYNVGNACVDKAVDTYLVQGTAPTQDVSC